ncbi:hypothetical protein METHB2_110007 [Candidatus Methylobacter favarea]|uniref:Uncharacterized protein n=1 Tax=Candidatus Methylobacter favarea TaxID=2707345 RepID=A0A8S0Y5P8_9GAMM|nr:hypothetical protein METHB2_110007 [Candidatus Methylobacter favarea]
MHDIAPVFLDLRLDPIPKNKILFFINGSITNLAKSFLARFGETIKFASGTGLKDTGC